MVLQGGHRHFPRQSHVENQQEHCRRSDIYLDRNCHNFCSRFDMLRIVYRSFDCRGIQHFSDSIFSDSWCIYGIRLHAGLFELSESGTPLLPQCKIIPQLELQLRQLGVPRPQSLCGMESWYLPRGLRHRQECLRWTLCA